MLITVRDGKKSITVEDFECDDVMKFIGAVRDVLRSWDDSEAEVERVATLGEVSEDPERLMGFRA